MKATGIIRRIDDIGRIVIPKEIRKQIFGTSETNDIEIEFYIDKGKIVLVPYNQESK